MDFKSLIKTFDPKSNKSQEINRFSSLDVILINKSNQNQKEESTKIQTVNDLEGNSVADLYPNQKNYSNIGDINEYSRNTITALPNSKKKNENSILSRISMFEKKNNSNHNNNKKEFLFDRNNLTSPFMSDLDINKINKKENNFNASNNKQKKEEIEKIKEENQVKKQEINRNDEKNKLKENEEKNEEIKIEKCENEEIVEKTEIKNENVEENNNIKNTKEKKENETNIKENEHIISQTANQINENNFNTHEKQENINIEESKIEIKEKDTSNQIIIKENESQNKEDLISKETISIYKKEIIKNNDTNKNEIDSNEIKNENIEKKNKNILNNINNIKDNTLKNNNNDENINDNNSKQLSYANFYKSLFGNDDDDNEKENKEKEKELETKQININEKEEKNDNGKEIIVNEENIEICEKEEKIIDKLKIEEHKENNEEIKEIKENKEDIKNTSLNNDDNQDNFEDNLDITKLIRSKESLNKNYDVEEENLDNFFKNKNSNDDFEKTFSNIELINQKQTLYEEDEMNESLIKISEKDNNQLQKDKNSDNNQNNINKDSNKIDNIDTKIINENNINLNIYEDAKNEKDNNINNVSNSERTKQMKDLFDFDEDENIYKKFNSEEFPIRRYDSETIDSGKKFFKFRFIKNKIENYLKMSITSSVNNNLFLDKSFSTNTIGVKNINKSLFKKSFSFKSNNLTISNMKNYDKEKEIRIYSSEFLKIVEKSIFSFNLKKYKESYGYLIKNGIIYNAGEYGEFLLTVSGFDKFLIGEFLAKTHFPNEKKEALNAFTSCIDVEYPKKALLESVKLLFSRVNLPKDANLILEIINSFSVHYFNDNKEKSNFIKTFGSSNNIYLLLSTVLAINTMFIRTDIKNLNIITKEEFIKMNKDVDKKVVEDIYLQLEEEPISMIDDDYSQNTYKKLSNLVIEKIKIEPNNNNIYLENNNNKIEDIIKKNEENKIIDDEVDEDYNQRKKTFSLSQNFEIFTKADKEILSKPIKFLKFSGKTSYHTREFMVYNNFTKLIWAKSIDPNKVKGNIHYIMISDIIDVFNGINHSEAIQRYYNSNKEKEKNNFITIMSKTRQIDLKAGNLQLALNWFKALKSLIILLKNKEEKKLEKQNYINTVKLKKKIGLIWKNSIIPKWGQYGDYLLFKIHEKKNDLFNLKFINNHNSTTIINDEKMALSKKIDLITKETENKKVLSESDFFVLYNFGLPFFVRPKIWQFLIGNPCNISQILYKSYISQVEVVNFESIDIKYHEDVNQVFSCDYIINQMIVDIIKIKDLFLCELISKKLEQNTVMLSSFRIIRIFFMIRNDLTYNKNIIPLIFIFLILGENEYNAFSDIYNLVCGTNTIKYLLGDEQFVKNSILFFNELISQKVPRVWEHFKKLEITTELYLIPWFEEIFTGTLNYKILLRVLDLYLLNGDYILYQVGLTIIKIQEEDILNSTISEVFRVLRRLPDKFKEDFFLEYIKEFSDIKEKYFSWNKENILGEQKQLLFQDFYEEEE